MHKIKKGLDIPISGEPVQEISQGKPVDRVALLGSNYVGMRPSMLVSVGDTVKIGQPVFECKKTEGVHYTAPAAGEVVEINRGDKRAFVSLVIRVADSEEQVAFEHFKGGAAPESLSSGSIKSLLLESGLWTALRTRPYSKVPAPDSSADALFICAMDTNPLALDPSVVIEHSRDDFQTGVAVLARLMGDKKVFVCHKSGTQYPLPNMENVESKEFGGKHPAGLVGTHIHFINPVGGGGRTVWHLDYQDVIAVGKLFSSGKLNMERVVSLAGPLVVKPRLVSTRVGAYLSHLVSGELMEEREGVEARAISGSILHGDHATGACAYLGRYHRQVTVIAEGRDRELLGWLSPGVDKYSLKRTFASSLFRNRPLPFNTNRQGSHRSMVPVGCFEKVMPLNILPTQLLRSLVTGDVDTAEKLGCLELDEEDLALCTFVSPGKTDFGPALRDSLSLIEKEG